MEVANGFSELNDPVEQERRFLAQIARGGDEVPTARRGLYSGSLPGMPADGRRRHRHRRLTMLRRFALDPRRHLSAPGDLRKKTPLLLDGVVQLGKAVGHFHSRNVNLESLRQ